MSKLTLDEFIKSRNDWLTEVDINDPTYGVRYSIVVLAEVLRDELNDMVATDSSQAEAVKSAQSVSQPNKKGTK